MLTNKIDEKVAKANYFLIPFLWLEIKKHESNVFKLPRSTTY